jgi:hypothetical protein
MLMQYVLDDCITSVLPWSLIVSRQPARFASPRASRRRPCAQHHQWPIPQPHFSSNSLPLNLFADPHPLTPVHSIFYKKGGGRKGWRDQVFAQFWCNLSLLDATLMEVSASVDSKPLTWTLSPLNATLTKNMGVGHYLWHGHSWLCFSTAHETRSTGSPV